MDLHINRNAKFTPWAVRSGALHGPFVVVDVGVQGGENPRWELLGDHARVYGFDALEEAIEPLARQRLPGRRYFSMALGSADGEGTIFVNPGNLTASSLYDPGPSASRVPRRVRIRSLDSLRAQGEIEQPDFMKIDVEGFEKHVIAGATTLLSGGLLALECESSFHFSPEYPQPHVCTLHALMQPYGMLIDDLNFNRVPREAFQRALVAKGLSRVEDQASVGPVSTLNVLFRRDFVCERDFPHHYPAPLAAPTAEQIVKAMIVAELHGLNDLAVELADEFREKLSPRLDADEAIALLADPYCRGDAPAQPAPRRSPLLSFYLSPPAAPVRAVWRTLKRLRG